MRITCNMAGASLDLRPHITDSLARLLYANARQAGNIEYTGKAASLLSITSVKLPSGTATAWYDTAMQYLAQAANRKWIAYTHLQIGYSLGMKFQFQSAIRYLLKAAADYGNIKDSGMLISTYTAISNMFHEFGDTANEKKYAHMAVSLVEQMHDTNLERRWGAYALLGISYEDNQEYDKALSIHLKNIKNAGNDWIWFLSYNNVGTTLLKKKDYKRALEYFKQALDYAKKINDDNSFATIYNNLGLAYLHTAQYAETKNHLSLALRYVQKTNMPQKLLEVYKTGWLLGKATGDDKSALAFFTKRAAIKDSLLNASRSAAVYDLQIKYESEEKEKENQRLQYMNALKTAEKEKAESDKRWLIIGSLVALALTSVSFVLFYRNRVIQSKLVEEQVFTKAIMEGEQNERIRIARDLHDSIGQILSVAKMNISTLNYQLPENKMAGTTAELVDNALVELRNISHNLMPEDLNFGLFPAIENICENINIAGQTKVTHDIPDELKQYPFEKPEALTIYRIVQEVLNNMIKHAEAETIHIQFRSVNPNAISINITDTGKGFDTAEIAGSRGLGWKNIAARVRMLDGEMQIRSEPSKGTQIIITIPIV